MPVSFRYASESDPGPYPVPANAPVEGGSASIGDRHVVVVDWSDDDLHDLQQIRASDFEVVRMGALTTVR